MGNSLPKIQDHWPDVVTAVLRAAEKDPSPTVDLVLLAAQLIDAANFREAERVSTALVSIDSSKPLHWMGRGVIRAQLDNLAGAEADLRKALDLCAQCDEIANIHNELGKVLAKADKHVEAEESFTSAIDLGLETPEIFRNRGLVRGRQGKSKGAEEDLIEAIKLEPTNAEFYSMRGLAREEQGKLSEAEADFSAAIRLGDRPTRDYKNRAKLNFKRGLLEETLRDATDALIIDPNDVDALLVRGAANGQLQRFADAYDDLHRASDLGEDGAELHSNRGAALLSLGRLDEAEIALSTAIDREDLANPRYMRGMTRASMGKMIEAEEDLTIAISKGLEEPLEAIAHYRRSMIRQSQGNLRGSESDLSYLIGNHQESGAFYRLRGLVRVMMSKFKIAEQDFTTALRLGPSKVPSELKPLLDPEGSEYASVGQVYANRGFARHVQKDLEGALEDLTQAVKLGQTDMSILKTIKQIQLDLIKNDTTMLPDTKKQGQDFWKQDLSGEDLSGRELIDANLTAANLAKSNLNGANLDGAILASTNLQDANLTAVNLRNARLIDTNLSGTDLTLANLEGALIVGATFSNTTRLPDWEESSPSVWLPDSDLARFTNSNHPDFWRPSLGSVWWHPIREDANGEGES